MVRVPTSVSVRHILGLSEDQVVEGTMSDADAVELLEAIDRKVRELDGRNSEIAPSRKQRLPFNET